MTKVKSGRTEVSSERRQLILDIAAKQFARSGYAATTVRDIADEAGILSGSLYHHFASKEAIIREILEEYLADLLRNYDVIVSRNLSGKECLHELVEAAFEMILRQPDSVALYQNEATFLQTITGFEFLKTQSRHIEAVWQTQLSRGQQEGEISDSLDPATTYRFIRDALWSVVRWYRPEGEKSLDEIREQFVNLLNGVFLSRD